MSVAPSAESVHGDGELLSRISNEMVRAQKRFFGKGPTQAKSYMLDDLLIIVMRGGLTTAEQTMLEFGKQDQVRAFRQLFENEMTSRLIDMIQELTSRTVLTYQSQVMFDPDVVVEMFIFDAEGAAQGVEASAVGQLGSQEVGEATDRAALDPASSSGQSED